MAAEDKGIKKLASCITAHAWNADRSLIAICPNSAEVHIFSTKEAEWKLEHILAEHDQVVTSIAWAPKSNRIVSCSQDRNAYVWKYEKEAWWPTLVILRVNRAATHVQWSPNEEKFAVATGSKVVSVCFFEEDNDWWVSRHIKNFRSTVTYVHWHADSILLAAASTDFKVRIFSAWIKEVDRKMTPTILGEKIPFGEQLWEESVGGWAHAIKFSPSGNRVSWVAHDSSIYFGHIAGGKVTTTFLRSKDLPFVDILWLDEDNIIGVGHESNPTLYSFDGHNWKFVRRLDDAGTGGAKTDAGKNNAFKVFQNKADVGESTRSATLDTKHQNCVNCVAAFAEKGNKVTEFSTSGLDGFVVLWRVYFFNSSEKLPPMIFDNG